MSNPLEAEQQRRRTILAKLAVNPLLIHAVLFERRHRDPTPDFHREIIRAWWSDVPKVGIKAFRGAGKSTIAEDALGGGALFGTFRYGVIVGASYGLACQRLNAIKHELRTNERIDELFGNQEGDTWNEGKVTLKNGTMIEAVGSGQSLRGLKHLDHRPDFVLIDDLEDYGEAKPTTEAIEKQMDWLIGALLPACDPAARIRMNGTPLDPDAVLERLSKMPDWRFETYPIVTPATVDPEQWERSNWEGRFPLERPDMPGWKGKSVREILVEMSGAGRITKFIQEYLCKSEEQALKPFQVRHIVKAPHIPDWAPSVIIIDPARTTNRTTSARTGYVAVSWVGARLYVRYAKGAFHKPDEIINETYRLDNVFKPISIRVEQDGLHEFLMQPYRSRMTETGVVLPIEPVMAPRERSKDSFIMGLQPFFEAGEVLMCDDFPDLVAELLAFPSGRKDVVNALAYAPRARPGRPVYPDFSFHHVGPDSLSPSTAQPAWLCVSARGAHTAAVLVQFLNGAVRVYADWVREGAPADTLQVIVPEARLAAGRQVRLLAPRAQFDRYNNVGLPAAVTRLKLGDVTQGPDPKPGILEATLRRQTMHQPAFLVARGARWTVNALAGGYARALDRSGILKDEPDEGYYRTLMEGLESFVGWLTIEASLGDTTEINYAVAPDGRKYISARATPRPQPAELKLGDFAVRRR